MFLKTRCSVGLALLAIVSSASATTWDSKSIGRIMAPDNRDCFFFELVGVPEADPILPANPWMAVPRTQYGFKEIYSMLLTAKATGALITVITTGQVSSECNAGGNIVGTFRVYLSS